MRELSDETLKKIAHEVTESLRQNLSVDWSARESVQGKLRLTLALAPLVGFDAIREQVHRVRWATPRAPRAVGIQLLHGFSA